MKEKSSRKETQKAKEFEKKSSPIAKEFNLRVSKPYGYYPEDVEKTIKGLKNEISSLSKENAKLNDNIKKLEEDKSSLIDRITRAELEMGKMQREYGELQVQLTNIQLHPLSQDASLMAMSSLKSAMTGKPVEHPTTPTAPADIKLPEVSKPVLKLKPRSPNSKKEPSKNSSNPLGISIISSDKDNKEEVALNNLITKKEGN